MPETYRLIILIQIPIIISIIVVGLQAKRIFDTQNEKNFIGFRFVIAAWVVNLFYVCFKYYSNKINLVLPDDSLSTVTDLISSYFFLIAFKVSLQADRELLFLKKTNPFLIAFLFALAGFVKFIYSNRYFTETSVKVFEIPIFLCDFIALLALSKLFKKIFLKYPKSILLFYGARTYAYLQILEIFHFQDQNVNDLINSIGFSLGAICKFSILIGMASLVIENIKELSKKEIEYDINKTFAERLDTILGRTFHEIIPPLSEIESISTSLLSDQDNNNEFHFNKRTKREIETIEDAVIRAKTILSASIRIYEAESISKKNSFENNEFLIPDGDVLDFNNVNTLIEIAILNFKNKVVNDFGITNNVNDFVKFSRSYASNCNIYCNSIQMIQVFFNLFKNSFEAAEKDNSICSISIKTRNVVEFDIDNTKRIKKILVEIADSGPGIPISIRDNVFQQRFSTKEADTKIKGFGLEVVKTYTELNNGSVNIESPILIENTKEYKKGVKFIFLFDKN